MSSNIYQQCERQPMTSTSDFSARDVIKNIPLQCIIKNLEENQGWWVFRFRTLMQVKATDYKAHIA